MIERLRRLSPLSLLLITLSVGVTGGVQLDRYLLSSGIGLFHSLPSDKPDFQLMSEAWDKIDKVYVDRSALDSKTLTHGAISGMAEALGDTGRSQLLTPPIVQADRNLKPEGLEGAVSWQRIPGTTAADVRIFTFNQGVSAELREALSEIQRLRTSAIVLDLRNAAGGSVDEAISTVSQFLQEGNVLTAKDAQGEAVSMSVQPGGVAYDIPMVVLVNSGTAGAAEIVAGALQDAKRARLVGETTSGMAAELNQFLLSDGSALVLTTQEWLTPNGRAIWRNGVTPDVLVSLKAGATVLTPGDQKNMEPEQLYASGDSQLLRALELFQ